MAIKQGMLMNLPIVNTKKLPKSIRTALFPKHPNLPIIKIPTKHQSRTINPWMDQFAKGYGLPKLTKRADLKKLAELDISPGNQDYRPKDLGMYALKQEPSAIVGANNHRDYLRINPHSEQMIRKIAGLLNDELKKENGLDTSKYRIRLIISS